MNQIVPYEKEMWTKALAWSIEQAASDLEYSIPIESLLIDPSELPDDQREFVKKFEIKVFEYALAEWQEKIEQCRQVLSAIIERRERRAMLWLKVDNYQDVEAAARSIIDIPEGSTGRQIESFLKNHLPVLDAAGVDPQTVMEVMAKTDSVILSTSRAVSRIVKSDLTNEEKSGKIRELIDDAATAPYASDVRKKWLNGKVSLPRDIYWCKDGTRLVTFICPDDDSFLELDKKTSSLVAEYGNVEPILRETRNERTRNELLTQLKVALAIVQSGDLSAMSKIDKDIADVLREYGVIEDANDVP